MAYSGSVMHSVAMMKKSKCAHHHFFMCALYFCMEVGFLAAPYVGEDVS